MVRTSGGHDYGFYAVTDTYTCKSCRKIVDVCVGIKGKRYTKEEIPFINKDELKLNLNFYQCPICGSDKDLEIWDTKRKKCPRCGCTLLIDEDEGITCWD